MTVSQACKWFIYHGSEGVIIVGGALMAIAAGAVAFRWVKGMLFG